MEQPSNTEEAREAFMRHVFGDMMRLEERIEETSRHIDAAVDNLRRTRTSLSRETEKLLLDALTRIERSAQSIYGSERNVAGVASGTARDVLLGPEGPVSRLNQLAERMLVRELQATRWTKKAMERTRPHWVLVVVAACIGGFAGGALVKWL